MCGRRMAFLGMCLLVAVTVQAARVEDLLIQLNGLQITADGRCLKDGKEISVDVVMNGDDGSRLTVGPGPRPCTWIAYTNGPASTEDSFVSLRIRPGKGRSRCLRFLPDNAQPGSVPRGKVSWDCCRFEPVQRVNVTAFPAIEMSYVRDLDAESPPGLSRRCAEDATLSENGIEDVQFRLERIYLQLGAQSVDRRVRRRAGGLLLNDLQPQTGGFVELTREGVVYRLILQSGKQQGRIAPNSNELSANNVEETRLGRLVIQVVE